MDKYDGTFIKMAFAFIATLFHFAFGGWSMPLAALIVLVVLDYFGGMAVAKRKGEIDSSVGREGAFVKGLYFVAIFAMRMIDKGLSLPVPALQTWITWSFIAVEGESIIENLGILGVPIPDGLRSAFKRLKDKKHDIPLPGIGGLLGGDKDNEDLH